MNVSIPIAHNELDRINLRTMRAAEVVAEYARQDELLAHERVVLDRVADECRNAPILELGVGGGRAVQALLGISRDYLGIDYSPEMVAACQQRFPQVHFALGDARRMPGLADASFKLVVFCCNGISMVGHEDRLAILREVRRVLKPGGILLFTTYNRDCPEAVAGFRWPVFAPSINPLRLAVRGLRFARDAWASMLNRRRFRRHEQRTTHYAIINDACHNHGVMLYYITVDEQRRQLEQLGFEGRSPAFDRDGEPIREHSRLDSMAFIARKPLVA